ncbi:heavy metal translocating P-type ATPase [Suttonella ornithocola]|uniref:Copper-exporting P-type ATPase A n=1 Tax=Suttonella ornithocola TaxID=279832 RepID=A0A380MZW2_9GAMM|nr:heavy metal translocating P-type ATPase [Suttonella ornithocola]SUO97566.1 Copper-exporting P-type ATPase A [Suttonella ornithocola]
MSGTCYHCQSAIPDGTEVYETVNDQEHKFCCYACAGVAQIISGSQLDRYYDIRNATAPRPSVHYDAERWKAYDLPEIAAQYVYQTDKDNEIHLFIDGIHCGACAWLIGSILKTRLGLESVYVNTTTARAEIHYPNHIKLSAILETIAALGYTPNLFTPAQNERRQNKIRNQYLLRLVVAGLGMMQVMMFATGLYTGAYYGIDTEYSELLRWISLLTTTPVFFYSGYPFLKNAWLGLKAKKANMDLPIALAIAGAYFASVWHTILGRGEIYFDSVTMFIFFLSISRFLEFLTRRRAQLNEVQFAKLLPEAVEKIEADGSYKLTPLTAIAVGHRIRILPTQTIAIDGIIQTGQTRVNESMLSGESTPISKTVGDSVFAGSHNLESPIEVEVNATGQSTTLAGIRRLMARAEQHKSQHFSRGEKLAQYTIIDVLLLAASGYLIWHFIDPSRAFEIALAILVATCPCALSLATPTVLTAAINHAHRCGILIKQSDSLDRLARIDTLLFDKTGTLTEGNYRLIEQKIYHLEPEFIWQLAKSLEQHSSHPIAWAITKQSNAKELPLHNVQQTIGQGVTAEYQNKHWAIGNAACIHRLYPDLLLPENPTDGTTVYLANEDGLQAQFQFDDPLRQDLKPILEKLNHYQQHIASGDKTKNVIRIAQQLNIPHYLAECTPQAKLDYLNTLNRHTLMIGDGINDAPVMAAADLSIAVGKANPLSQTQADIVLLRHGPEALPYLFNLAHRAQKIIRENLIWATVYNLVVLPLAITGYLTPWIAALGMSISSLIVVFNALRITRTQPPKDTL